MFGRSKTIRGRRSRVLIAVLGASALVMAGCADNSEGSSSNTGSCPTTTAAPDPAKPDDPASALPEKIKSSGKLVVGVNIPYAPNEFKDESGKIVGFDVDLLNAVAEELGLTTDYREADFDKIIPALQACTFDVGMSSFTDTKEREQQVDFVTYFSAGIQWAQQTGKPIDPNDACGKKVAVQATTVEDTEEIPAKSEKCVAEGKPPIEKVLYDRQDDVATNLVLGNVDAMSADSPVTAYAIKQSNGQIEAAGGVFDAAPYGWPVSKGSPLATALQQALQRLIDNGRYKEIATTWGVEAGMIEKPVINGATS
ncbi:ABC transporter substrate-binding protein [Antrihabitans sp. YC2-6]|uniref:ABC transporter substrate-binding protein n=1 Tax=Antrihabitans sp. YC2-6 TaxID=2799498 RepID=UPI0018F4C128|nr:ABC transporter substrate-binding protein [Antrihabitans sp. YC2-6]MBJ8343112.1 ABC transporter substrate-binding protein [Antrihabitans sp. YC2-6]